MANHTADLFSSLISDIKSYSGKDPLLPWLRGIRKLKESLPPEILNEKLPRFLQKCAQAFESDRRYRNDLRYLRVWLQLMDFVDDPRAVLKIMEVNSIGAKRSLFYQAYALFYEKIKKFEEAEKMYHVGVQNLAEPADELQKSYEQFLHRMKRYKNKRALQQERRIAKSARIIPSNGSKMEENNENVCPVESRSTRSWHDRDSCEMQPGYHTKSLDKNPLSVKPLRESRYSGASENPCVVRTVRDLSTRQESTENIGPGSISNQRVSAKRESAEMRMFCTDDTVALKFADSVIIGKSESEDACHHGLVEPTINMKEAMNAINSMFREPIETAAFGRRSRTSQPKEEASSILQHNRTETCQLQQQPFAIYVDDEGTSEAGDRNAGKDNLEQDDVENMAECSLYCASRGDAFVFPSPKDLASEGSDDQEAESSPRPKFREDTVVCRFVGSTILAEPEVENVCHHGLVDPTINLKEAMADINNMFGKPMDFVRTKRQKRQDKAPESKSDLGGFSILPDDDLEPQEFQLQRNLPGTSSERDLFEPSVFTREAMDDINKMFGMPLDF